jgi:pyruvate dehydrogenase E2 component (dihydrolipoamide acetyltransferase)
MEQATFVEWLVEAGDEVTRGQVVAMIETAKSLMEIEFFEDGVIEELLANPGEVVAVGAPIARYRSARAAARAPSGEAAAVTPPEPEQSAPEPAEPAAIETHAVPAAAGEKRRVQKDVRMLAERLEVDLASVTGTGHGGRIRAADVLAAAGQLEGPPAVVTPDIATAEPAAPSRERSVAATRASPRARRLAEERGVDLSKVTATGPHGQITGEDVERHLEGQAPATAAEGAAESQEHPAEAGSPASEAPPRPAVDTAAASDADRAQARRLAMRQAIAELMARSKREVPHYYLSQQVDMTTALDWLERENLERPVTDRLLPAVLLIKAVARAIDEVPEMNGFWVNDKFLPGDGTHPGIAISLREGGLVAPAIHHADRLSLEELMTALRDLVTRTRSGVLQRAEMTDPTITITNLGDQGVDAVYGVIYPPQVALVGFGRVGERPWSEGGMLGARRILTATLAADHRASDGHRGGLFLASIGRWLQEPEKL